MIQNAIPHFFCQIQTGPVFFKDFDNTHTLFIVMKTALLFCDLMKCPLSGMTKRGMPKIMTERNCFGQIFIQVKCSGYRSGILGNLKSMCQTGSVMITFRC